MKDLHLLPKVRDGWTYLYAEHCRIEQDDKAIALHDARGRVPVPCAMLATLMLGPGVTITHAAVRVLAEHGCLIIWGGEEGARFYAQGMGETRSSANLLQQARLWADPALRQDVVRRLYQMRFAEHLPAHLSLRQIRGKEGMRVRAAYARASQDAGIPWSGRSYERGRWKRADSVNRALSAANSCLYGICHAAIVSAGFSPALGFIHTGKMLSFVYDIADLYKAEITIPVAFRSAAESPLDVETRARFRCRELFKEQRLLARLVPDIQTVLACPALALERSDVFDGSVGGVGGLWDADGGEASGGVNYADDAAEHAFTPAEE